MSSSSRSKFNSGSVSLDRYFRDQVTQDIRRRVTACFVAVDAEQRIAGYYTLASSSMLLADLPAATAKKLPRYPLVPAVHNRPDGWPTWESSGAQGKRAAA